MGLSPTQRTLAYLREEGFTCGITEKWNQHAGIRQDLFGFIDLVALHPALGTYGVQATSGTNVSARIEKIRGLETHATWLQAGNKILVIGWRKVGPRGKRKVWEPRIVELTQTEEIEREAE